MQHRLYGDLAPYTMESYSNLTGNRSERKVFMQEKPQSITPLCYDDIDAVVALSRQYFPRSSEYTTAQLKKRTTELYFKNGSLLPDACPLVSRTGNGRVNGFLGVITKHFRYRERRVDVAHCHHLMATDEARKQLMPLRLLQHFLSGPQDLFFSDGSSEATRLLWQRLGGEQVTGESLYYKIPLRPASFAAGHVLKNLRNLAGDSMRWLASGVDAVAGKMRIPLFYHKESGISLIQLDQQVLSVLLAKMKPFYHLFPEYHPSDIQRLFHLLEGESRYGKLHKMALLDSNHEPVGWFIYYAEHKGLCEVIQAVAIPGKQTELFSALSAHAYSRGGIEVSGRLMPGQLQTPFTTKAIAVPGRMWTLIKSDDTGLKHLIQSGKAFLTRLEGDLWVL